MEQEKQTTAVVHPQRIEMGEGTQLRSASPPPFQLNVDGESEAGESMELSMASKAQADSFAAPPEDPALGSGTPIQRTIFNMGDDEALASRDGARLGKKLKDDYVEIPLPKLKSEDGVLAKAGSPFVVMFHGSTLRKLGAEAFLEMLIEKGYPRSKGLELVLITCGASKILGPEAQMLANVLQSKVRAAKGNVEVQANGVPFVRIKKAGSPDVIHKEDIFDLMGGLFEDFASGWNLFTPEPKESFKAIFGDASGLVKRAAGLTSQVERLNKYRAKAPDPNAIETVAARIGKLSAELEDNVAALKLVDGAGNNADMLKHRQRVDGLKDFVDLGQKEVADLEAAWKDKNNMSISMYDLMGGDSVVAPSAEDIGSGWDFDDDLDFGLEAEEEAAEELNAESAISSAVATVASSPAPPPAPSASHLSSDATQTKTLPNAPLQRQITTQPIDDDGGAFLKRLIANLHNVELVAGADTPQLNVSFAATLGNSYGVTRLYMDDTLVTPHKALIPANAGRTFRIEIVLNGGMYSNGTNPASHGSLIETLTHEWELHGRQHAMNIARLRSGSEPDRNLDHMEFFKAETTDMDSSIALQIRNAPGGLKQNIFSSYLNDSLAHVDIVLDPWIKKDTKVTQLYQLLSQVDNFGKTTLTLFKKQELNEEQNGYMFELEGNLEYSVHEKPINWMAIPAPYAGPKSIPFFKDADTWIAAFNNIINDPSPGFGEVPALALEQLRDTCRAALPMLRELEDLKQVHNPINDRLAGLAASGLDNTAEMHAAWLEEKSGLDAGIVDPKGGKGD